MSLDEAQSFFDLYGDAFTRKDHETLADQWIFPCYITQQIGPAYFKDRESFVKNLGHLSAFYDAQGVAVAKGTVTEARAKYDGVIEALVDYTLNDAKNETIAAWLTTYVLRRTDDGWKACFAIADGEIDAWAARGTPIGGGRP